MNTNGHQISEYHTKNTSMVDFKIDTEKLVNGLYILNITLENGANINRKMVVNH